MSMIKDMKTYLIAGGVSVPVYLGCVPEGEKECIGLYRYAGGAPIKEAGIERIGLQARCRAESYEDAVETIRLVCSLLWDIGDESVDGDVLDIDGTKYVRVFPVQSAFALGCDESRVYDVAQNFLVSVMV